VDSLGIVEWPNEFQVIQSLRIDLDSVTKTAQMVAPCIYEVEKSLRGAVLQKAE